MNVIDILSDLKDNGYNIALEGDGLRITGGQVKLNGKLLEAVRHHKQQIVSFLSVTVASEGDFHIPVVTQSDYRLSYAQRRLWLVSQQADSSRAYNITGEYKWVGQLDVSALCYAVEQLIMRHEILRTVFVESGGEVRQQVLPGISLDSVFSYEETDEFLDELRRQESLRVFDLANGPLFKLSVVRLSSEEYVLLFNQHHIISDAWSMDVFKKELFHLYEGGTLAPLRIQYKDYAAWQHEQLAGEQQMAARAYWHNILSTPVTPLDLHTDYPRPRVRQYGGAGVASLIDGELYKSLQGLCSAHGVSSYSLLTAVVHALLYRYSGQEDIITGLPVAGRSHADLSGQLGYYVNTVFIRSRIKGTMSFSELLSGVHGGLMEAYAHQEYPFDLLLEELNLSYDRSRSPVFDVFVNYDRREGVRITTPVTDIDVSTGKFDLSFHFTEYDNGIGLSIRYDNSLFSSWRMQGMVVHFSSLLAGVCAQEKVAIGKVDYLSIAERELLSGFNATGVPYNASVSLSSLLHAQALRTPDRAAILFKDRSLSYLGLDEQAGRLAGILHNQFGIGRGDRVGLMMDRSAEMMVALYGILKSGAAYVPLDPAYPSARVAYMLEDSKVGLVITHAHYNEGIKIPYLLIEETDLQIGDVYSDDTISGSDLAYIIYTSGSTGLPKGVAIRQHSVVNLSDWLSGLLYGTASLEPSRVLRVLLTASINFDASVKQLFSPLFTGNTLVLTEEWVRHDIAVYHQVLLDYKIDVADMTPSYLSLLLESATEQLSVRDVLCGGEALPRELVDRFYNQTGEGSRLINVYGPTEACVDASYKIMVPSSESTIGRPVNNAKVYILDTDGSNCGVGVRGEIYIGGAGLADGYWEKEERTAEKFKDHGILGRLYQTGDLGYINSTGELCYTGRKDDQVKVSGHRIELGEIEAFIQGYEGIQQSVVVLYEGQLAGYVVWNTDGKEDENKGYNKGENEFQHGDLTGLRIYLSSHLPAYMVPGQLLSLSAFPLTPGGKIDRKRLPIPTFSSASAYIAPTNPTEQQLASIWSTLLNRDLDRISITDNFFELGGHSLSGMRMAYQVYHQLGKRINLGDIFKYPTLKTLSDYINDTTQLETAEIPQAAPQSDYVLSHAQRRLWLLSQQADSNRAYNIAGEYTWKGPLNIPALSHALEQLIHRHEILRTIFIESGGEVRQQVLPGIIMSDVFSYEETDELLGELRRQEFLRVFDLATGPLFKLSVLKLSSEEYMLFFNQHHIISDAWSMDVFRKELFQLYDGGTLAPLRIQYKDYAEWQYAQLAGEQQIAARTYWHNTLSTPVTPLDLHTDYPRPRVRQYGGAGVTSLIDGELHKSLLQLCLTHGVSSYSLLTAVVHALLYRYSGQEDIITGLPVAGRSHADLSGQLGYYVNTVFIRSRIKGTISFSELLSGVHGGLMEAYAHQDYPFDLLLEELNLSYDRSRSPVFDVFVNYDRREGVRITTPVADIDVSTGKFDLSFHFTEYDNGIALSIRYDNSLFSKWRMEGMLAHFSSLLKSVYTHDKAAIGKIDYLSVTERDLLSDFNTTAVPYNNTISLSALLHAQVVRTPDRAAILFKDRSLSYLELDEQAGRLAGILHNQFGIGRGDRVGLMMDRSAEMMVVLYGILKSGAAYVPLDPAYPSARVAYMLEDSKVGLVITHAHYSEGITIPYLLIEETDLQIGDVYSDGTISGSDLAYIIYTSGSTGLPKGVAIRQHSVVNLSDWLSGLLYGTASLEPSRVLRVLLTASINFDASVKQLFSPLFTGNTLVLTEEWVRHDIAAYHQVLLDYKIDVADMTPSYLSLLLESATEQLSLSDVLCGGEALPRELVDRFYRQTGKGSRLINVYGPTEACVDASYKIMVPSSESTIGRPVNNAKVYILDADGSNCGVGVRGEIYIGGAGLADGYWEKEERTAEQFKDHGILGRLYQTGDLGYINNTGELCYSGRKDDQVKISGHRIELGEIEAFIQGYEGIQQSVVVLYEGQLAGYVVWNTDGKEDGNDFQYEDLTGLRNYLSSHLPAYMVPGQLLSLSAFPLTPGGKIDRKRLPIPTFNSASAYIAPANPTEHQLAIIWSTLLNRDHNRISITDNFFELGGHSLSGMRMAYQVYHQLEKRINLGDIFRHPTIQSLAAFIDNTTAIKIADIPLAILQSDYVLSHAQRRLWLLSQQADSSRAYNIAAEYTWKGALNIPALSQALEQLIQRHEILRTIFIERNGELRQQVLPNLSLSTVFTYEETDKHLDQLRRQESLRVFDLANGPLFKLSVVKISSEENVLLFNQHHIISDAWSMDIFRKELFHLYHAGSLTPLRIQYKDYATWQHEQLTGHQQTAARQYWHNILSTPATPLDIHTDLPRPAVRQYGGAGVSTLIDGELYQSLQAISISKGVSSYSLLTSLIHALLYRYSNQEDIITGLPVAGRSHADLSGQLGYYVNTVFIRSRISADMRFSDLLSGVHAGLLEAYAHQDYPFDLLLEDLNVSYDRSRSPIFDVFVNYDRREGVRITTPVSNIDTGTGKFDLSFHFTEYDNGISVSLRYDTALFINDRMQALLLHLTTLCKGITTSPDHRLQELSLFTKEEKQQLLSYSEGAYRPFPLDRNYISLFSEQVSKHHNKRSVSDVNGNITYGILDERSSQIATAIIHRFSPNKGAVVGVYMERSIDLIASILGIWKAGCVYLPLDPSWPSSRLEHVIAGAGLTGFISHQSQEPSLKEISQALSLKEIPALHLEDIEADTPFIPIHTGPDDIAYLLYTSGSTGIPKGVQVTQGGMLNNMYAKITNLHIDNASIVAQTASHSFDISIWQMLAALLAGGAVHIYNRETVLDIPALLNRWATDGVTVAEVVPSYLAAMLDIVENSSKSPFVPKVLSSVGEALPAPLVKRWFTLFPDKILANGYGPTEGSDNIAYNILQSYPANGVITLGRPLYNIRLYVLDENKHLCPIGVSGEIVVSGIAVSRGYIGLPEQTAAKFLPDPFVAGARMYLTGDYGSWDHNGLLRYHGRKDEQVKLRGQRLEYGEIESVLLTYPGVLQCAVKYFEGESAYLCAYIRWQEGTTAAVEEVQTYLSTRLPAYMVPSAYMNLNHFPVTVSGKISRKDLPVPQHIEQRQFIPPVTDTEKLLSEIWSSILRKDRISTHDSFFELGGHSLSAMRMIHQLNERKQVQLHFADVFKYSTIASLAALLDKQPAKSNDLIPKAAHQTYYPVSHAQKRLWLLSQQDNISRAYNITDQFEWRGALDEQRLQQAFEQLISRHEILRTRFIEQDGILYQVIEESSQNGVFNYHALNNEIDSQAHIRQIKQTERARVFDLENGPLLFMHVMSLSDEHHVIIINQHHIIADAWSIDLLRNELGRLYRKEELLPLRIQYKDYTVWRHTQLAEGHLSDSRTYWHTLLSKDIVPLDISTDYPRAGIRQYKGSNAQLVVDDNLQSGLSELASANGVSIFTVLTSILQVLLYRYTGQDDIIIGLPVAGRSHSDLSGQAGCYVNTVLLRTQLQENDNYQQVLSSVHNGLLQAYAHQDYPFDLLIEELNLMYDRSRSPLFDVMVNYERQETTINDILPYEGDTGKFDLSFHFTSYQNCLLVSLQYDSSLFSRNRIAALLEHYRQLCNSIIQAPAQQIVRYEYIPEPALASIIEKSGGRKVSRPFDQTLHSLFSNCAIKTPDINAIYADGKYTTYRELDINSGRIATWLKEVRQIKQGDHIAIMLDRSVHLVQTILAILKAGAVYIPIDPEYPAERIAYLLEDSEAKLLLTVREFINDAEKAVYLDEIDFNGYPPCAHYTGAGEDVAYIIYTSGSSGKPKGVQVTHSSVVNLCYWHTDVFGLSAASRSTMYAGVGFDASVWEMFPVLLTGGCLYPMTGNVRYDLDTLVQFFNTHHITHTFLPTPICEALLEKQTRLPADLLLLTGGDKLAKVSGDAQLSNNYGPTECTVVSTSIIFDSGIVPANISIGRPIDNMHVFILDRFLQPVPTGNVGEMYIAGAGLSKGYWKREELNNERFIECPFRDGELMYRTGDMAKWLPDHTIAFLGRTDKQVKIRGYRIELQELEAAMNRIHGIQISRAITIENPTGDIRLAIFYSGEQSPLQQIRNHLAEWLPVYMIPDVITHLEEWPLTANGKIDDKLLLQQAIVTFKEKTYVQPANQTEEILVSLWQKILGTERVGVTDDFFASGGQSIKAMQLIARIKNQFNVKLGLKDIFNHTTIQAQASIIGGARVTNSRQVKLGVHTPDLPVLYLIPPIIGSSTVYSGLAKALQGTCNCIGLQYPGFEEGDMPADSLRAIAGKFQEEILPQSKGEAIYLLGYSLGAWVAYELALQLQQQGKKVNIIVLDKEAVPATSVNEERDISPIIQKELAAWLKVITIDDLDRITKLAEINYRSMVQYHNTELLKGDVLEIVTNDRLTKDGWLGLTNAGHKRYVITGNHYEVLQNEHISGIIAEQLDIWDR